MSIQVKIGTWHEKKSRQIEAHTGYAADYIIHQTKPGDYDAYLTIVGGYTIPMPQWLSVGIAADITDGRYFNGFGGLNHSSTPVRKGPSTYHLMTYAYDIDRMVSNGQLSLLPEWEFMNQTSEQYRQYIREYGLPVKVVYG